MKKKQGAVLGILLLTGILFVGCSGTNNQQMDFATEAEVSVAESNEVQSVEKEAPLPEGVYSAEFHTDSSMFCVNEAYDGKGTLIVENGKMTIHISLGSKNIVNLYSGLAEDAQKEGAKLLSPTTDTVTYSDGWVQDVYGFDIPVPVLDEEFDVSLVGTKGKWYDHKVSVSNPMPLSEESAKPINIQDIEDGKYTIELTFEGGSGRAEILPAATVVISEGTAIATIEWSSPNYDYMIVDGEKYLPVNTEGNSVFEIPVSVFGEPIDVIGDTVAMSTPHEIEYTLTFHSNTMKVAE